MSYKIKFGKLRGMTPEEAFQQGEIEELVKLKQMLVKNFDEPKYKSFQKMNLEGYLAIEEVLLKEYQALLKEFVEKYDDLSEEKQKQIASELDKNIFYNNDIAGMKTLLEKIKA